ncbi:MAG: P-loop NTPase [bacterium]|nr:P-loop NTPase [bacterium]
MDTACRVHTIMIMDPRLNIIDERLRNIKRLIAVSGGKGGIGKSLIASTLALTLTELGYKVGLLDLDFCSPSIDIILGIRGIYPKEDKGVIPPEIYGIKFISIIYYAADKPSPLRGIDISNAMIELLSITRWGLLDFLIIDMPPGIGDATLDVIRLIKRAEFIIIATPSKVTMETVKKVIKMLKEARQVEIIGVIENMKPVRTIHELSLQIKKFNIPLLGEIDFDEGLEASIGNVGKLSKTNFAQNLKEIVLNTPALKLK